MAQNDNKKMIPLHILNILKEDTDDEHCIMQKEIVKRLQRMGYDTLDKKTVSFNIESLKDFGYEIERKNQSGGNSGGYYLIKSEDELDNEELRILIDTVLSSKHIPEQDTKYIVEKLKKLGNQYFRRRIGNILSYNDCYHTDNHDVFNNIKNINDAMDNRKKIKFSICRYDVNLKLIPYDEIIFNPYILYCVNGKYVVLGNVDNDDKIVGYEISKITDLVVLDEKRKEQSNTELAGQTISSFIKSHPNLTSGVCEAVQMDFDTSLIDDFVDTFGINRLKDVGNNRVEVSFRANKNDIINFVLLHRDVRILSPQKLRDEIRNISINIKIDYSETNDDKYSMAVQRKDLSTERYSYFGVNKSLTLSGIDLSKKYNYDDINDVFELHLSKNNISDFSFLKDFKNLHFLYIRENNIDSFDFVKELPELQFIDIQECNIKDFSGLLQNKALRSLSIRGHKPGNFKLYDLKNLEYLELEGDFIDEIDLERIKANNPILQLSKKEHYIVSKRIMTNYSIDVNKKLPKNQFVRNLFQYFFGDLDKYGILYPSEDLINDSEFKSKLKKLYSCLSDIEKTYLQNYLNGNSKKEIAELLKISISELIDKTWEIKGKKDIKELFKQYIDYEKYKTELQKEKDELKKNFEAKKELKRKNLKIYNNI